MTTTAATSLSECLTSALTQPSVTMFLTATTIAAIIYYFFFSESGTDEWIRYGVKSPKLSKTFFFGADFRSQITSLFIQYGDTVGVMDKKQPLLFTTNFDLLRHVLIKDFNNFVDRGTAFVSKSPFAKSLFFASGNDWRRHRHIVSPTFSTGKLKYISKSVSQSAGDLANYLEQFARDGSGVPIKDICGRYTCEIIAKTAFGVEAKFIGKEEIQFFEYAKKIVFFNDRMGIWRIIFMLLFRIPNLANIGAKVFKLQYFDFVNHGSDRYFDVTLRQTIAERRQQQKSRVERSHVDFLDLLLKANDAAKEGKLGEMMGDEKEGDYGQHQDKVLMGLTDEEMIGHSMLVIFAGMETTATTLQMCLYELARHPDLQDKVCAEIEAVIASEPPTQEELNRLTYMEQVINETLRMYPPVPSVNRKAKETRTYDGITIPKGTLISIPYFYISKDPKVYPEPEKFDPDRFSTEEKIKRDPMAFTAFGHGPRLCVGMRLAYLELKLGLVYILKKLRVVLNEKTEPKIGSQRVALTPQGLITPVKPIVLAFKGRSVDVSD